MFSLILHSKLCPTHRDNHYEDLFMFFYMNFLCIDKHIHLFMSIFNTKVIVICILFLTLLFYNVS